MERMMNTKHLMGIQWDCMGITWDKLGYLKIVIGCISDAIGIYVYIYIYINTPYINVNVYMYIIQYILIDATRCN